MRPPRPSLVLFDLDGVLVEYDRAVRIWHLAAAVGVPPDAVRDALFASGLEDRFDAGSLDADDYLAALGAALGRAVDRATWTAARGAAMRMDAPTPRVLAAVAAQADVAILTNNGGLLVDVLPALFPGLARVFGDRILCSGRLGARKPAREAYVEALRRLGHPPGIALFLDDSPANVAGARDAGLQAAHVASPARLREVLAGYRLG